MTSFVFDIGERARKASRFIGHVRSELQHALICEKKERKITQQEIANLLGVNRSVINRQLMGTENLTLRSVAELAWALNWDICFELRKAQPHGNQHAAPPTAAGERIKIKNYVTPAGGTFIGHELEIEAAV
jgi:hypothetical protein